MTSLFHIGGKFIGIVQKHIYIISYVLLILPLPFIWLSSEYLYAPEEISFTNYQNIYETTRFVWSPQLNCGEPSAPWNLSLLIPNALIFKLLSILGFNNHLIQIIFLELVLLSTFMSIIYFLKVITPNRPAILLGALFYIFNFYFAISLTYTAKMYQLILMPVGFVLLFKYLDQRDYKYAIYNFIIVFFFQAIFTNPPQLISTLTCYSFSIIYYMLKRNKSFNLHMAKHLLIFFALLLPIIFCQGIIAYDYIQSVGTQGGILDSKYNPPTTLAQLSDIFQFRGVWWERESHQNVPYSHWNGFYDSFLYELSSFFLIILVMSYLIFQGEKKIDFIWAVILIISILITAGDTFKWVHNLLITLPGFFIFREPWQKFMPLVLFSSTALFASALSFYAKFKLFKYICLLVILAISIKAFPFYMANFFDHSNEAWKQQFINPPGYWYDYESWSYDNKDKYILTLPYYVDKYDLNYEWYDQRLGNSNMPMYIFFGSSNIIGETKYFSPLSKFTEILGYFGDNNYNFTKICTIDYLLVQNDLNFTSIRKKIDDQTGIKYYFEDTPYLNLSNKLFLFKIKPEFRLPLIFIPNNIMVSTESVDKLPNLIGLSNTTADLAVFFETQNRNNLDEIYDPLNSTIYNPQNDNAININKFTYIYDPYFDQQKQIIVQNSGSSPTVKFLKIDPTKYDIKVYNVTKPFPLVLSECFDEGWKVYLIGCTEHSLGAKENLSMGPFYETWLKDPIDDKNHLIVNGYANLWIIDPFENNSTRKEDRYDLEMIIEFRPQRFFYIGMLIQCIMIFLFFSYIIYCYLCNKWVRNDHMR